MFSDAVRVPLYLMVYRFSIPGLTLIYERWKTLHFLVMGAGVHYVQNGREPPRACSGNIDEPSLTQEAGGMGAHDTCFLKKVSR